MRKVHQRNQNLVSQIRFGKQIQRDKSPNLSKDNPYSKVNLLEAYFLNQKTLKKIRILQMVEPPLEEKMRH